MTRILALTMAIWMTIARPGIADTTLAESFDIRLGPLRVAELIVRAEISDRQYALAARVTSAGLAGAFRDVRFDMQAQGRRTGIDLAPIRYQEDINTGRRQAAVQMTYHSDLPVVTQIAPDRPSAPWDLNIADQSYTLDPLSALLRVIYLEGGRPCNWNVDVFDGRRRSELALGPARSTASGLVCDGYYRRIAGFSPEDMAERENFPLTVHYEQMPQGELRLTRIDAETLYGRVRIVRRD